MSCPSSGHSKKARARCNVLQGSVDVEADLEPGRNERHIARGTGSGSLCIGANQVWLGMGLWGPGGVAPHLPVPTRPAPAQRVTK